MSATIQTRPATAEYRENYDRIFGKKAACRCEQPPDSEREKAQRIACAAVSLEDCVSRACPDCPARLP